MAEITNAPTELSKVIPVSFKINDVNVATTGKLQTGKQFNTSDTDAWLKFDLEGLSAGGAYDLTLINLDEAPDNSIFKHTDIVFSGVPFYYKLDSGSNLETNEIRHAGRWLGQVVVRMENGDTTSRQFVFSIAGHILDGKVAQVVLLEDYNALIAMINASKDLLTQYNVDYAALLVDLAAAETTRTATYNQLVADQQANIDAFDVALETGIVAANLAEKLQDFETTNNSRLLSVETALEQTLNKSAITLSHMFADNTARDAYFVANPSELVEQLFIKVGTGYQQRLSGSWQASTAIVAEQLSATNQPIIDTGNYFATDNTNAALQEMGAHKASIANPHGVTKSQVGLGNVDNTTDANKPVSTAVQTALNSKADKQQEAWITPTLLNGWTEMSSLLTPRYFKDSLGMVHLSGKVGAGLLGQMIFTLPTGYQTSRTLNFAVSANNSFGNVYVSGGNVVLNFGSVTNVSLDGIKFRATQ